MTNLLEEQRNPSAENYHRWLTPEEFGDRFGASNNDVAVLTLWLESNGFVIERTAKARNAIVFRGTAGQVASAFQTQLHFYQVDGERHFANSSEVSIPARFADIIGNIQGLDDFRPKPSRKTVMPAPDYISGNSVQYVGPGDLAVSMTSRLFYSIGFDGSGQKLVVVGQTDISLPDIRMFRQLFSLPARDPELILVARIPECVQPIR